MVGDDKDFLQTLAFNKRSMQQLEHQCPWFVNNISFTSKHTHPVDVEVKQGCTCCNAQMGDHNQNNNKNILWSKDSKNQPSNKV